MRNRFFVLLGIIAIILTALAQVLPKQGDNVLDIALVSRPANIGSNLTVEDLEVVVRYGTFPTRVSG